MRKRVRLDSQTGIVSVVGDMPYWHVKQVVREKTITYEEPGGRKREGRKVRLLVEGALAGYNEYPASPFWLDLEQCYGGYQIVGMWPINDQDEPESHSASKPSR